MIGILSYKTWLIEPTFASRMAPIIMRSIEQGTLEKFYEQNRKKHDEVIKSFYAGVDADIVYDYDGVPPYRVAKARNGKKVAIITMMGAITKNGDACSYGMRDHQNQMTKILKNPEIAGVVFHYNNAPGGSHDGTPEIAHNIFNYPLNNVGFVDGMAASAHYYMASQNKHIMMNSLTDSEVGSIGSLIVSENIQNLIDSGRFPSIEIIRAPQSVNKALFNYIEPLSKAVRAELNEDLRLGVDAFIADVKRGRGNKLKEDKEMFTGKMYPTDIAISNGLADSKGTLQDAINLAASMPATKPASTSNNNKSKEDSMKINTKRASTFHKKNSSKKVAAEGDAAAGSAPQWTEDAVYNTDGSGDGAICTHADTDGNMREFETKVDNNQGNEPPTDPAVTEDDNWSLVQQSSTDASASEKKEDNAAAITKLNADLKAFNERADKQEAEIKSLNEKLASLQADNKKLADEKAELQKKLDAEPAGNRTTVISKDDEQEEGDKSSDTIEAEKYAKALNNNFL
jgi:protease IV